MGLGLDFKSSAYPTYPSREMFRALPWIDWVYLLAMAVVGAVLIFRGLRAEQDEG